jgi:hypothetical protein
MRSGRKPSEEAFDELAFDNDDDDRLQIGHAFREHFNRPDDLMQGQRRKLFQLQLDHRQ